MSTELPPLLYRVTVRRVVDARLASLDIVATNTAEAIVRADAQLDSVGIKYWSLVSVEQRS